MVKKKPKTPEDERFIEVINFLISEEKVKNERQFLLKMEMSPSLLSKIKNGTQSATRENISKLVNNYQVNELYIYNGGEEPILKDGSGVKKISVDIEEYNKLKKELDGLKDDLIDAQKTVIELTRLVNSLKIKHPELF